MQGLSNDEDIPIIKFIYQSTKKRIGTFRVSYSLFMEGYSSLYEYLPFSLITILL